MLPFRARPVRTALLTTALLTAVSLPATGARAAQGTGDQHGAERSRPVGTAQHYDRFPLVTGGSGGQATAIGGVVTWTTSTFVYGGRMTDAGRGTSQLTLRLSGPRASGFRFFTADNFTSDTSFAMAGDFDRVEVTLCWRLAGQADRCAAQMVRRQ
jgi:hypothetical protein